MSRVRVVVGPTASGKSRIAMAVAKRLAAQGERPEIVAIDAFTIYRGMDIGTAKPTRTERDEVPHHMIDVAEPSEELSVAQFQRGAREAIEAIQDRGGQPILVGGSGLYFRAVVDDLRFPPTDDATRRRIEEAWRADPQAAWEHLATVDPVAADKIDPANLRRTVRALEVLELTGEPFSSFSTEWETFASIYDDLDVAYLEPSTEELRDRIRRRTEGMLRGGLLAEARELRDRVGRLSRTASQAIGYAEAFRALDGELEGDALVDAIADRTWAYARRQRSWFRRDPRCVAQDANEVLDRLSA